MEEKYTQCYIQVCYFDAEKQMEQEQIIHDVNFDIEKKNFMDEQLQQIKLEYNSEQQLCLYLSEWDGEKRKSLGADSQQQPQQFNKNLIFKIPLNIEKYLNLDIGKCYIGFLQDSVDGNCAMDLMGWSMFGYSLFNQKDLWNGLTLDYTFNWPLNLIFSQQIMEKYQIIFRFLFPIRLVKVELHQVWLIFHKQYRSSLLSKSSKQLLKLRNQMSLFIENFWQYFQLDIIEVSWSNLKEKISQIDDFEQLRNSLERNLNEITNKLFLQNQTIMEHIFQIIQAIKSFIHLVQKIESGMDIEIVVSDIEDLQAEFEKGFLDLLNILILLNKSSNQTFLYQLLIKLDYNTYYKQCDYI